MKPYRDFAIGVPRFECKSFNPGHRTHYGPARSDASRDKVQVEVKHLQSNSFSIKGQSIDAIWYDHDPGRLILAIQKCSPGAPHLIVGTTRINIMMSTSAYLFYLSKDPFEPCAPLNN